MEAFVAGAAAALIGVLSGQKLLISTRSRKLGTRVTAIEEVLPQLITRGEVQNAFAEMAKIEGARVAQQQQQAQQVQQARTAAGFGTSPTMQQVAGLNQNINQQLEALTERMNALNSQVGLK
jgi:small-conductance mechanosensitive channel